jgi:hypothetical protein
MEMDKAPHGRKGHVSRDYVKVSVTGAGFFDAGRFGKRSSPDINQ